MKISISTKSNSKYTATSGLYSSVYLLPNSKKKLNDFCIRSKLGPLSDDVHCTVMYSTVAIAPKFATKFSKTSYSTKASKVTWWAGHDNAGYIVLKLVSGPLSEEHTRLQKAGCHPTFTPYEPHVTLISPKTFENSVQPISFCMYANELLKREPLILVFGNQQVEDLK